MENAKTLRHTITPTNEDDAEYMNTCGRYGRGDPRSRKYTWDGIEVSVDEFFKIIKENNYDLRNPLGIEIPKPLLPEQVVEYQNKAMELRNAYSEKYKEIENLKNDCKSILETHNHYVKLKSKRSKDIAENAIKEANELIEKMNNIKLSDEYLKLNNDLSYFTFLATNMIPFYAEKAAERGVVFSVESMVQKRTNFPSFCIKEMKDGQTKYITVD